MGIEPIVKLPRGARIFYMVPLLWYALDIDNRTNACQYLHTDRLFCMGQCSCSGLLELKMATDSFCMCTGHVAVHSCKPKVQILAEHYGHAGCPICTSCNHAIVKVQFTNDRYGQAVCLNSMMQKHASQRRLADHYHNGYALALFCTLYNHSRQRCRCWLDGHYGHAACLVALASTKAVDNTVATVVHVAAQVHLAA